MMLGPNGELLDDDGNPLNRPIGGVDPGRLGPLLAGRGFMPTANAAPTPAAAPDPALTTAFGQFGYTPPTPPSKPYVSQPSVAGAAGASPTGRFLPDTGAPIVPPDAERATDVARQPGAPTAQPSALERAQRLLGRPTMVRTNDQTTTRYTKMSPEHKANLSEQGRVGGELVEAQRQAGALKAENAGDELAAATDQAANEQQRRDFVDRTIADAESDAKARRARIQSEEDRLSKMEPRDYWKSKTPGEKAGAYLSIALSGIGDALIAYGGGRGNGLERSLQMLQADRDRFDQQEREKILRQEKLVERMKAGDERARAEVNERLRMVDVKSAATDRYILSRLRQALAARGKQQAEIDSNIGVKLLEQQLLEKRERALSSSDREVAVTTSRVLQEGTASGAGAGKPPTASQGKANEYLSIMLNEAKTIESLPPLSPQARAVLFEELALRNAADKNPTVDYAARLTGMRKTVEQQLTGTDRQAYAAYLSYLDPLVRARTGAAAPASEVAALAAPIMPAKGDQGADLAAKRDRRKNLLYSITESSNDPQGWRARIDEVYRGSGVQPTVTQPGAGGGADVAAAKAWLQANPSDPRAGAIRQKLERMGAF